LTANWNPEIRWLTDEGKTLILNTVAYAIGASAPPATPTLSVARSGNDLVITYAGGTLQSAGAVNGPWTDETGASPLTVQPTGTGKFYRVRAN
jgi:hypothetical protein